MLTLTDNDLKRHPFDLRGDIEINYKEDFTIYDKCDNWGTETLAEINQVRTVFADGKEDFAKIFAYTFFYKPNGKIKTFTIPETIDVPSRIIALSKKTDRVKFFIDSFKLTEEEGRILNIAYLSRTIKEFYPVCNERINQGNETVLFVYGKCTGMTVKTVKANLRIDKKLISFDLMNTDGRISIDVLDCIYAKDLNIFFCDILKKDGKL